MRTALTKMDKLYAGDAVYVEEMAERRDALLVTTHDGYTSTNSIVLEFEVAVRVERYLRQWIEKQIEDSPGEG